MGEFYRLFRGEEYLMKETLWNKSLEMRAIHKVVSFSKKTTNWDIMHT